MALHLSILLTLASKLKPIASSVAVAWQWCSKALDNSPVFRVFYMLYASAVTIVAIALYVLLRLSPPPCSHGNVPPVVLDRPVTMYVHGDRVDYGDYHGKIPLGGKLVIAPGKPPRIVKYRACLVPKVGMAYSDGAFRPVGGARLLCLNRFGVEALAGEDRLYGGADFQWPLFNTVTSSIGYALPFDSGSSPVRRLYIVPASVALRF